MKATYLLMPLLITSIANAEVSVEDFKVKCSGQIEVIDTFGAGYSEGLPPNGRFDGQLPSAGFSAIVHFTSNDPNCVQLDQKYKLDLFSANFEVYFSVPPVDLATAQAAAKMSIGKTKLVHFENALQYSNDGKLPLYPHFIAETLWLVDDNGSGLNLNKSFKVDALHAHGVPSLKQLTDAQKVNLAEKIVELGFESVKKPGWRLPYINLLASLEPGAVKSKIEYLHILISLFEGLDPMRTGGAAFFDFAVGGSTGEPIATKIASVAGSTGALSVEKIQSLAYQFPALLLLGHPKSPTETVGCFPITVNALSSVLSQWLNTPSLNYQQKRNAKTVAGAISGKAGALAWCLDAAKADPAVAEKAAAVFEKL